MERIACQEQRRKAGTPPAPDTSVNRRNHRRRALATLSIGAVAVVTLIAVGHAGGLRINFTPSYALGIWRIVPLDRHPVAGELIFLCPPQTPAFILALDRGYLRRGLCPGWITPLIKTVVALPGQRVEIGASVSIDGVSIAHSQVRNRDALARTLRPWSGGVVPPGHLFLHSDFAGSYDSRYFGPVPADGFLGLARPVLTFGP